MAQNRGRAGPPEGTGPQQSDRDEALPVTVPDITNVAEQLRRVLATDRPDYERGWRDGYRYGYDAGWNTGYGRARVEMDESWERLAKKVIATSGLPFDELRKLRDMPTGQAWQRWRERHGGEYRGGPVDWDTGRPLATVDGGGHERG